MNLTTVNDWSPETRSLLHTLKSHGFTILSVHNGEELTEFSKVTLAEFVEQAMSCDESSLRVLAPDGVKKSLYLVYGNSPGELVCDYAVHPGLDAVVDEHYSRWEGKKQPTTTTTS